MSEIDTSDKSVGRIEIPEGFFQWLMLNNGTIRFTKEKFLNKIDMQYVHVTAHPPQIPQPLHYKFAIEDYDFHNQRRLNANIRHFIQEVTDKIVWPDGLREKQS